MYRKRPYVDTGKIERIIIDLLDRFRELRHEELYELDFCVTEEDADEAVQNAEKVLAAVEKLIQ